MQKGGTVIPIIISSDKTQVTIFRNKTAYPVYLTIGNIPKEIRKKPSFRAFILIGYLPTTKLDHIRNEASRRRCLANLFHACMRHILGCIKSHSSEGLVMRSGAGCLHRTHPIFATFAGDYPEQILATCCITGDCPVCTIPRLMVGRNLEQHPRRSLQAALDTLALLERSPVDYVKACRDLRMKPIFDPFWAELPYSNIYHAITPDLLHQVYQGVFRHVKDWVIAAFGKLEIDTRFACLPPSHNVRHFHKGISHLQRITGQEHRDISRLLLSVIADARLPDGHPTARLICAVRAITDFLYIAQSTVQTTSSLSAMREALQSFHENKQIFVELGIRSDFQIPKLHSLDHYVTAAMEFGSFDNSDTQYTERLHIDMTKDAYRATNHKDEYPQMTLWLERKEKMQKHADHVKWRLTRTTHSTQLPAPPLVPGLRDERRQKLPKHPSKTRVSFETLAAQHGAKAFLVALQRYVLSLTQQELRGRAFEAVSEWLNLGFNSVPVYYRLKFVRTDPFTGDISTVDSVHVQPTRVGKYEHALPSRFDTALVRVKDHDNAISFVRGTSVHVLLRQSY